MRTITKNYTISLSSADLGYKTIFFYFFIFLLTTSTALIVAGLPESLVWSFLTLLLVVDFILEAVDRSDKVNIYRLKLFAPLFLILLIDKGNDFVYSHSLKDIVAMVVGSLLIHKIISISKDNCKLFWTAFFHGCHASYIILLLYFVLTNADLKDVDQYLNYYFLMILFYHFNVAKNKFLFIIMATIVLYFYYLLFEPRFLILCSIVMLFCMLFMGRTSIKIRRLGLKLFWIIIPPILIGTAIYVELFGVLTNSVSTEFTGRGILWYNFISLPIWQNSVFWGLSSAEAFVNGISDKFVFNDSSYVQEYMGLIISGGNTHNGIVYIFYNAGLIGIFLFYFFLWTSFKNDAIIKNNWIMILILGMLFLLFGRSLYGVYFLGNMMLFSLIIPLEFNKKANFRN